MTKFKSILLKLFLVAIVLMGEMITCDAQNSLNNSTDAGKAVIYNQSGMGATILLVFAGLIIILLVFKYAGKYMATANKKPAKLPVEAEIPAIAKPDPSGEINAAIAMALYLYTSELHDQENPVITMIKVSRTYSPWSSKIYGLRKSPR